MSRAAAGKWLGAIAVAAFALSGCGGDDGDTTTPSEDVTADSVQKCLEQAGLDVTTEEPASEDMLGVLYINVDQFDQIYLAFMDSAESADGVAEEIRGLAEAAGGNAGVEVVEGDIVLARARDTTQKQVDEVTPCLSG